MRLLEFASAEEQLALWKLVSDNVWKAIATQAQQEEAEKKEQQRLAKLRTKVKPKKAASMPDPIPALPPPTLPEPKPLYPNKPVAKSKAQSKPAVAQTSSSTQQQQTTTKVEPQLKLANAANDGRKAS